MCMDIFGWYDTTQHEAEKHVSTSAWCDCTECALVSKCVLCACMCCMLTTSNTIFRRGHNKSEVLLAATYLLISGQESNIFVCDLVMFYTASWSCTLFGYEHHCGQQTNELTKVMKVASSSRWYSKMVSLWLENISIGWAWFFQ